jgi:hypothetical protein
MNRFLPFIKNHLPEKIPDLEKMINNYDSFAKDIKAEVKVLEKKYNLKVREVVVH